LKILDNLPEEDEELTPETVRPDNLNDPLPFLKAGLWEKVHIASLVPKEKKEIAAPPPIAGMMGGGMMGGGMGGMAAAGGDAGKFWKSAEKRVMVRALDFTPRPDNNYRYRVRI